MEIFICSWNTRRRIISNLWIWSNWFSRCLFSYILSYFLWCDLIRYINCLIIIIVLFCSLIEYLMALTNRTCHSTIDIIKNTHHRRTFRIEIIIDMLIFWWNDFGRFSMIKFKWFKFSLIIWQVSKIGLLFLGGWFCTRF